MKKCYECLFYRVCGSAEYCNGICGSFYDKSEYEIVKKNKGGDN